MKGHVIETPKFAGNGAVTYIFGSDPQAFEVSMTISVGDSAAPLIFLKLHAPGTPDSAWNEIEARAAAMVPDKLRAIADAIEREIAAQTHP